MTLARTVQSLQPGDLVELFELDLSPIGVDEVWRFTPTPDFAPGTDDTMTAQSVTFGGRVYYPADVKAEGFEVNGQGQIPQPTLSVSNVTLFMAGVVLAYQDAVGCKVTRTRTFAQYLDGGAEADPNAAFPTDVYVIEQKTKQNKLVIEWRLAAETDQEGVMLPKRTVVRDYCPWSYRVWNAATTSFDYTDVECPYVGTKYLKANGDVTANPALDDCGRHLDACVDRFGKDVDLPFGGFPGVGLNQISNGG